MDFEKIRYFLTLADTLNYTKAAQQLFISQSMLSRHIKSIEDEFGIALFTRNTHGVALTPAGVYMANGLRSINTEYSFLLDQARATSYGVKGNLHIGVQVSTMLGGAVALITKYEQLHPELNIVFTVLNSPDDLYQELLKNSIDFALSIGMPALKQKLTAVDLCENRLCIAMSNRNPLAVGKADNLSIDDLKDQIFITPADSVSTAYKELIARCSRAGFTPNVIARPDIMAVALMVELNHGITFFHEYSVFRGHPNLVFKYLRDADSNGCLTLYCNPNNSDPKVLTFLAYAQKAAQQRG